MTTYRVALIGLVGAGLIVIAAFALPWASANLPLVSGLSDTGTEVSFTGRELYPMAAAMPLLGFAAVAGVFATRGWARVIVGLVVVGAGLVTAVSAIGFGLDPQAVLAAALVGQQAVGQLAGGQLEQWASTPWWALGLIGGLALTAVGGLIVVRGRTWPGLSQRYERSVAAKSGQDAAPISTLSAWDALDRGEDPTT